MTPGELTLAVLLCAAIFVLSLTSSELSRTRARERLQRQQLEAARAMIAAALNARCRVCDAHPAIVDPYA